MKATIVGVGICLWIWVVLHASALAIAPPPPRQVITLDVGENTPKSEYQSLMARFRDAVKAPGKTCHCLPMAAGKDGENQFVEVQLKAKESGNIIRLAFQRSDLYLEGYADIYKGKCRFRIFTDSVFSVQKFLCENEKQPSEPGKNVNNIGYKKSYNFIEKDRITRDRLGLNMINLESRIKSIYGKLSSEDNYENKEREFLLMAIQIVAEAARFKYIEYNIEKTFDSDDGEYKTDRRAKSLQNEWGKLSEIIAKEKNPNGVVKMPGGMFYEKDKKWETETMSNLKSVYCALLKYVEKCEVPYFFNNYNHLGIPKWDV